MSTQSAKLQVLNASQLRTTRNELPLDVRRPVIETLNGILAEMIDVSLAARHAHWNVRGRGFLCLHDVFGRVHRELDEKINDLGERVAVLGGIARGTVQTVARETALDPFPTMATSEQELLEGLTLRLGQISSALRHAMDVCTPLRDPVSLHQLTDAAATIDKLLWLTESHSTPVH